MPINDARTKVWRFFKKPTSSFDNVRMLPWTRPKHCSEIASHAMVPFYGQGMKCALSKIASIPEWSDDKLWTNSWDLVI